jgi:glycerophosphoryl diester phosphodiesterase
MAAVVAHRGASATSPENTVAALRAAAAAGARWAEIDARLTACGALVVIHDARLERTTNGAGEVRRTALRDIERLDAGAWFAPTFAGEPVPTLIQALDAAASLDLGLNVELKAESDDAARATGAAAGRLLASGAGPTVISSFAREALIAAKAAAPDLPHALLVGRAIDPDDLDFAEHIGAAGLHADRRAFTKASLGRIVATPLWTAAYTVNEPAEARRLWALGVRSVITDRPEALLAACRGGG